MKVNYSSLSCPHCGSTKFNLFSHDSFLCEYCNKKFSYDLEEIDFSSENKVFRDELAEQFYIKIDELNQKKKENHYYLVHYKSLAYPKKFYYFSIFLVFFSILMFFATMMNLPALLGGFIISLVCLAVSVMFFIFAKIRNKKAFEKYQSLITYYANQVVNYENEISIYSNFISRLIK